MPPVSVGGLGPRTVSSAPPARAAAPAARRISRLVHEPRGPPSRAISPVAEAEPGARSPSRAPWPTSITTPGRPVTCRLITTSGTSRLSCSIRAVAHPRAAQQHPVHLLGQGVDQLLLDGRVLVGVGHEDVVVAVPGLALGRLDQRREERVGDVGDDQADVVGTAGDQRAGGPVGPVAELLGAGQHPAAGLRVDQVRRRERAGHRGDVHAGGPRDVADGGWHGAALSVDGVAGVASWMPPINANGCAGVNGRGYRSVAAALPPCAHKPYQNGSIPRVWHRSLTPPASSWLLRCKPLQSTREAVDRCRQHRPAASAVRPGRHRGPGRDVRPGPGARPRRHRRTRRVRRRQPGPDGRAQPLARPSWATRRCRRTGPATSPRMLDKERVDVVLVTSVDATHDEYIVAALRRRLRRDHREADDRRRGRAAGGSSTRSPSTGRQVRGRLQLPLQPGAREGPRAARRRRDRRDRLGALRVAARRAARRRLLPPLAPRQGATPAG